MMIRWKIQSLIINRFFSKTFILGFPSQLGFSFYWCVSLQTYVHIWPKLWLYRSYDTVLPCNWTLFWVLDNITHENKRLAWHETSGYHNNAIRPQFICLIPNASWFQLFLVNCSMCIFLMHYIGILLYAMKTTRDAIKLGNFTDWLSTYRTITYSKIIKIKALLFFQKLIIQFRHFCTMAHMMKYP